MDALIDKEIKKCLEHLRTNHSPLTIIIHQDEFGNLFAYKTGIDLNSERWIYTALLQSLDNRKSTT